MKQILKSKKFWTLVAAIVAALSAFFCSCTAIQKVTRHGVHCDTVRYEQIIKHKDFLSCLSSRTAMSSFAIGTSPRLFVPCIDPVPITPKILNRFLSDSPFLLPSSYRMLSTPLVIAGSPTFIVKQRSCSTPMLMSSSSSRSGRFGIQCLACMIPVGVVFRRGGRKGRPRPRGTKTLPLGGLRL